MKVFAERGPWLFSRSIDLWVFGGSALASWLLVALGIPLGLFTREVPSWVFFSCVIAIDVAHVWSTGFRAYFDHHELRARPWLYAGVPALVYLAGVALHALGALAFWRVLAYLAVFHFVRQQAGFMRLYARRAATRTRLDDVLEQGSIYASMLIPLLYWHAALPREFDWFMPGDFVASARLTAWTIAALPALTCACLAIWLAFAVRQLLLSRRGQWIPGKTVLLIATASCWWLGIVVFDSDYVFTVTNVLIHGVPYFVLTHRYALARAHDAPSLAGSLARRGLVTCALLCIVLAIAEETLWDRWVWHERPDYFGEVFPKTPAVLTFLVPLLALPQAAHYVLDGFLWRVRRENPVLRRELESA